MMSSVFTAFCLREPKDIDNYLYKDIFTDVQA